MSGVGKSKGPTLGDVFPGVAKEIAAAVNGRSKEEAAELPRGILWRIVAWRVNAKVKKLTKMPIRDVLGGGYLRLRKVREYAEKHPKLPRDKVLKLPLKHTITSEHKHSIELEIDGWQDCKLEFDINLSLKCEGGTLKIEKGCLASVRPGSCTPAGTFKCTITGRGNPVTIPPLQRKHSRPQGS